jgi:sulfite exporter TauE/SafE
MAAASLMLTALALGLAGTPHCAAMCGAACAGLTGRAASPGTSIAGVAVVTVTGPPMRTFLAGRLAGYAAAGALAALATQGLGGLSAQGAALRPLWTFFHLAVLAWGLTLLVLARQPAWAQRAGLAVWARLGPRVRRRGGLFTAGALWVFMPCGLLWSALLVASLTGDPAQGALAMALFGVSSSLGLVAIPGLLAGLRRLGQSSGGTLRGDWPTRLAGGLLAAAAIAALWMDLGQRLIDACR